MDIHVEVLSPADDIAEGVDLDALGLADLNEATTLLLHFVNSSKWASVVSTDHSDSRVVIEVDGKRWWLSRRSVGHDGPPKVSRSFWKVGGREVENACGGPHCAASF